MEWSEFLVAFGFSLFSGLATVVGCVFIFFKKKISTNFLSVALGFSAGVMIYVSFVELLAEANVALSPLKGGDWITLAAFFGGIVLIAVIDKLIPERENPHELPETARLNSEYIETAEGAAVPVTAAPATPAAPAKNGKGKKHKDSAMMRVGLLSALAIAIHNFPEGLATFTAASQDLSLGLAIAVAVAIHNIPEGITIALPVYQATGSRGRAFLYTLVSGLCEPLGALFGFLILKPFINATMMGVLFAIIAGIMVYISLDELLPAAHRYGKTHQAIYGLIAGMAVMAISLVLL